MAHYLMKYKGKYRILPILDEITHDFPRDINGEIDESYDDIYISCQYGNQIFTYGHDTNGRMLLTAYIPSIGRGHNIIKAMDEKQIPYTNYLETDSEITFRFKAKDIDDVAKLLKAKTNGAKISPFSRKNLPKAQNVQIPTEEIERYKAILSMIRKGDLLLVHKVSTVFLETVLQKKYKKLDKSFDFKTDMKKCLMSRMVKEYIWTKGMWSEYLKYLEKEIKKFYSE